jgi:hypothetical protein
MRFVVAATALSLALPLTAHADEADECASAAEEASVLESKSDFVTARDRYLRCARATCPKVVVQDCTSALTGIDKKLPTIVFAAKDASGHDLVDVTVSIGEKTITSKLDGKAIPMNPGELKLHFDAKGVGASDTQVVVREGEQARVVSVVLGGPNKSAPTGGEETVTPTPFKIVPWVMLGLGVGSLAAFGALQGVARGELSDVESGCGATKTCAPDVLDPIQAKFTGSAVAFAVGLGAIATAAGLWIFAPKVKKSETAARVTLDAGPGGAFVGIDVPF